MSEKSGGMVSLYLCRLDEEIVWLKLHMVTTLAGYILRKRIILLDQVSPPDQVLPTEWSLLPQVFNGTCREFGCHLVDLLVTRPDTNLPIYTSPFPDPVAWKEDAFQHPWNGLSVYAFPLLFLPQFLWRVLHCRHVSVVSCGSSVLQKEWFPDLTALTVEEPLNLSCCGIS